MSEFEHCFSRAGCTFSMQDSRVKSGSTTGHKTQQAPLLADSGLYNSTFPSQSVKKGSPRLVYKHHGPDKVSALSIILAHPWALKSSAPILHLTSVSLQNFLLFVALLCSCFAHCCHDPFIVRSASTFPWFHSVCASVSTENCLFLFLSLFLFLGGYLNTTRASVQPSIPLHQHRSMPPRARTNSVYVRTTSADFAPDPSSALW